MIQVFRKVLCPVDFSAASLAALDLALKIAQQNGANLLLLNVAPVQAGAAGFQPVPMDPYLFHEKDKTGAASKPRARKDSSHDTL